MIPGQGKQRLPRPALRAWRGLLAPGPLSPVGRRSRGRGAGLAGGACLGLGANSRARAEPPGGALPRAGSRRGPRLTSAGRRRRARHSAAVRSAASGSCGSRGRRGRTPGVSAGRRRGWQPERAERGAAGGRHGPGPARWREAGSRPLCLQGGGRVRGARGGSRDALPGPRAAAASP